MKIRKEFKKMNESFFNISKLELVEKIDQLISDAIDNKVKTLTGLYRICCR